MLKSKRAINGACETFMCLCVWCLLTCFTRMPVSVCVCVCVCVCVLLAAGRSQSLLQVLTSRCCKRQSLLHFIECETCLLWPLKFPSLGTCRGHGRCGELQQRSPFRWYQWGSVEPSCAGLWWSMPVCDVSTQQAFCCSSVMNNEDSAPIRRFILPHSRFRSRDVIRTSSFTQQDFSHILCGCWRWPVVCRQRRLYSMKCAHPAVSFSLHRAQTANNET